MDGPLLPDLDSASGHLPPGRYGCDLSDVHDRFVRVPDMEGSSTRSGLWSGLIGYLAAWGSAQDLLADHLGGQRLVKCVWLAGGFISAQPDPANVDLTVVLDGAAVDLCKGRPGAGIVRRLSDRDDMLRRFNVSACAFRYRYVRSPFRLQSLGGTPELDYLAARGAFDDWWQRTRPAGEPKGEPTIDTSHWNRGYLEVRL
jgi:hypothetical protein